MPKLCKEKLNELKRSKNYTSAEIAKRTGLPKSTIDKIFGGFNKNPTLDSMKRIAEVLDCGIDDFLIYENEPSSPYYVDRVVNKISMAFSEKPNLKILFELVKKLDSNDVEILITMAKRMADK